MSLTAAQVDSFTIAERVASGFSIIGVIVVIGSFLLYPPLRKPTHRLMFYASLGNAIYIIATMIATAGMAAGPTSPLCQFQAFLIQMFPINDVAWNFCMAINVYFIVFRNYTQSHLKALEWRYLAANYGLTFLLALSLCFATDPQRGKVYGAAGIWCTISSDWDFLRLVLLYGPVWIMIFASLCIYIAAGVSIYKKDVEFRRFASRSKRPETSSCNKNQVTISKRIETEGETSFKMTEVQVSSEATTAPITHPQRSFSRPHMDPQRKSGSHPTATPFRRGTDRDSIDGISDSHFKPYSVAVETGPFVIEVGGVSEARASAHREDHYASWTYTKYCVLFFTALIVTWLPASITRIYALVYNNRVNYGLDLSSAIVLPLMGFWNMVIYVVTSWPTIKVMWRNRRGHRTMMIPQSIKMKPSARLESHSSNENLREAPSSQSIGGTTV